MPPASLFLTHPIPKMLTHVHIHTHTHPEPETDISILYRHTHTNKLSLQRHSCRSLFDNSLTSSYFSSCSFLKDGLLSFSTMTYFLKFGVWSKEAGVIALIIYSFSFCLLCSPWPLKQGEFHTLSLREYTTMRLFVLTTQYNQMTFAFVCAFCALNQFSVSYQEFSSSMKCTSAKGLRRAGHPTFRRLGAGLCMGVEPHPWSST